MIYLLVCEECKSKDHKVDYVGETCRRLKDRIGEHFSKIKNRSRLTEIGKHDIDFHDGFDKKRWSLWVLDLENDDFCRKAKESFFLFKLKPSPNINKRIFIFGKDFNDYKPRNPTSVPL